MLTFFREALEGFVSHGAILPSSPFLTKRMLDPVVMKVGVNIVELGAGTGSFTRKILERLPSGGRLIVLELNPVLADHLKKNISDHRVTIIQGDAVDLRIHLQELKIDTVDYVISGLPIGNFRYAVRQAILVEIQNSLSDTGRYIQFQYFLASLRHIRRLFDASIIAYELRNVPPAFVYECKKRAV